MGIILFFKNIVKPKNWPLLFFILLNLALITFLLILAGCGFDLSTFKFDFDHLFLAIVGLVLYLFLLLLTLTPIGEIYLRITNGAKLLYRENDESVMRIFSLFDEVYEKAKEKSKGLSKKVKLCYYISDEPNAYALGRTTLAVSTGLMSLGDEEIKGILAHEFGHLASCDSIMNVALIASNSVLLLAINLVKLFFLVFLFIFSLIFYALTKTEPENRKYGLCHLFSNIITLIYTLWVLLGNLLMLKTKRSAEYKADAYAKDISYGPNLSNALIQIDPSISIRSSLIELITHTHPDTAKRIEKLQQ